MARSDFHQLWEAAVKKSRFADSVYVNPDVIHADFQIGYDCITQSYLPEPKPITSDLHQFLVFIGGNSLDIRDSGVESYHPQIHKGIL
jgi:hypothetical protein